MISEAMCGKYSENSVKSIVHRKHNPFTRILNMVNGNGSAFCKGSKILRTDIW